MPEPKRPRKRILTALAAGVCGLAFLAGGFVSSSAHARYVAPPERPTQLPPDWIRPDSGLQPVGPNAIALRWLGTAGFEVRTAKAAILIDPYFSRPSLATLLSGPLKPDVEAIRRGLRKVDAVFVSHAHFDHLVDAPEAARQLGVPLYASDQALRVAAAEGLPAAQQRQITHGKRIQVGDIEVEAVGNQHSDMPTQLLAGGDMPAQVKVPMFFLDYHNGPTFGLMIRWRGRSIYHNASAQIVEEKLGDRRCDVLLQCLSGWRSTPQLMERIAKTLKPRVFIPTHDDDFFKPLAQGFVENPLAFRALAFSAVRREMPATALITLDFLQEARIRALEDE